MHLQRQLMKEVKPKHKVEIAEDFRNVFRTDDRHDTKGKAKERFNNLRTPDPAPNNQYFMQL